MSVGRGKAPLVAATQRIAPVIPTDVEQVYRLAELIMRSELAPYGMRSPDKIAIALLTGLEVGLPPMAAVQSIAIVRGRATIWGDGALGVVIASGLLVRCDESVEGERDHMVATCTVERSKPARTVTRTYSLEEARWADLIGPLGTPWDRADRADAEPAAAPRKPSSPPGPEYDDYGSSGAKPRKSSPWNFHPRRMLAMRARSYALRDAFADVLRGIGIREALDDEAPPSTDATVIVQDASPAAPSAADLLRAKRRVAPAALAPPADEPADEEPAHPPAAEPADDETAGTATGDAEDDASSLSSPDPEDDGKRKDELELPF